MLDSFEYLDFLKTRWARGEEIPLPEETETDLDDLYPLEEQLRIHKSIETAFIRGQSEETCELIEFWEEELEE